MSLNGRIAIVALGGLLLAPLWLPLLPVGIVWWRSLRRRAAARGLRSLNELEARTVMAHAEASMPAPPVDGWFAVARNVDRYFQSVHSPRHWRSHAVLLALEFAPLLRLQRPLSRLPLARRRVFLQRHLATTTGLMAIPALARQLIRMGYYTLPDVAVRVGFRTMRERHQAPLAAVHAATAAAATRKAVG